jgi:hypothetical protein
VKFVFVIVAVVLLLAMVIFRLHAESGMKELERCREAVRQAKSWTAESISEPVSPNFVTTTNRTRVSCPDDYEYLFRSRTPDDVITEQSTIRASGMTFIESRDGKWETVASSTDPQIHSECGKGPALLQQTVLVAIIELPRRRAGKITEGQLQTIGGASCRDWSLEFGNEWPQIQAFTVCIDPKTHLPRRITFVNPGGTNEFKDWNSTVVQAPTL